MPRSRVFPTPASGEINTPFEKYSTIEAPEEAPSPTCVRSLWGRGRGTGVRSPRCWWAELSARRSMRFGGQSLLQKALTDRRQHAFWWPESSVRFGGQSLLQKALTEGTPRSLCEVSARPVLPQRMLRQAESSSHSQHNISRQQKTPSSP